VISKNTRTDIFVLFVFTSVGALGGGVIAMLAGHLAYPWYHFSGGALLGAGTAAFWVLYFAYQERKKAAQTKAVARRG
jgi:uncharacterized membrane protein YeiH